MEHLALDAGQRKDRQVDDHDDELTVEQRPARFFRGGEHFGKALAARQRTACQALGMGQAPHAVLHDHHRAVNDDAEVERAQAHQVGAHLVAHHAGEGEQHRQRDHHRGDERRTQVAEEQEQDRDDQQRTFEQIFLDGGNRPIDQHRAVVLRDDDDAWRHAAADVFHLRVDRACDGVAVLADQHEHRAEHHLAAVARGCAAAQLLPHRHLGHIAQAHRHGLPRGDDDVGDVGQTAHLPGHADQGLLAAFFDVAGADVRVVALQRGNQIAQAQAVGNQFVGQRRNLKLLAIAADGIDFGDAGHRAQLRLDDPVLHLAQIGRRVRCAVGFECAGRGFHRPHVDLAQAGRDWAHRW